MYVCTYVHKCTLNLVISLSISVRCIHSTKYVAVAYVFAISMFRSYIHVRSCVYVSYVIEG